jgi:diguanylate cyclase
MWPTRRRPRPRTDPPDLPGRADDRAGQRGTGRALPAQGRLNEQIRDAGDILSKELEAVSKAIQNAQKTNAAFGKQLAGASKSLDGSTDVEAIKTVVTSLTEATRRVHKENQSLETRLADSTAEVERLREHLEQVRRDATTDGLTNLANRKAFDDELDRACQEGDEAGTSLCLAVLDIDHFKGFNDTWGHQTGDQVIRYVASVIGRVAAMPRFAARYGGEEFAMIFPREAPRSSATLEEIRVEVSSRMLKRRSTNEDLGAITISSGFAERKSERERSLAHGARRRGAVRLQARRPQPRHGGRIHAGLGQRGLIFLQQKTYL